jgi:asparagine synthase (glutamine-hydrolysing)|tara:strand:+ start:4045 stop:5898 length:1854 start_codon:yes stop_codon:yes gene_type:complete
MCGIFAVIGQFSNEEAASFSRIAHKLQAHRGPDKTSDEIIDLSDGRRVLLGHQRLSILDLSDDGTQPMTSKSGNSTIIFNGEIYNYLELSRQLSVQRRTGSDTEVLLELSEANGPQATLDQANGMWALVHVVRKDSAIYIARDRAGKKPLYIWRDEKRMVIASELKTVAALSGKRFKVNRQVLAEYIDQGLQDSGDESWLAGIASLPAGSLAQVGSMEDGLPIEEISRWAPQMSADLMSFDEATDTFRDLFSDSIKLRLRSDVPVGITLSGGLDSSLIAAEMVKQIGDPKRVFAISAVSPGQRGDESEHVRRVCDALDIPSHLVDLAWNPTESADLLEKVTWHNDAPLGSFSNVAFYRLMELARKEGIKVVLSGQGADELFCGYKKYYFWALREQLKTGHLSRAASNLWGSAFNGTVMSQLNFAEAQRYLPGRKKRKSILVDGTYENIVLPNLGIGGGSVQDRQIADLQRFSVPYLTHYEDRNSMAHGVEVRLPYLDFRLMEFGINLPLAYKVRGGWTKYVMRKAYKDMLPKKVLFRRDKQGFTNPQSEWMRGGMREQLDSLFRSDARMYQMGLVDRSAVLELWEQFLNRDQAIWDRQMFAPWALEIWLNAFEDYLA